MEERNRVTVKIYGQEYTIAGELPEEHIRKIAEYVDGKMQEISKALPAATTASLAVLSAVNTADELFKAVLENNGLHEKNQQLLKDTEHYVELWEEAKKNLLQYKESTQSNATQKEEMEKLVEEKNEELSKLRAELDEVQQKHGELKAKNEDLLTRLQEQEESKASSSSVVKELEAKCRDVESSFFDLQMENIQLKGELDRYKKMME